MSDRPCSGPERGGNPTLGSGESPVPESGGSPSYLIAVCLVATLGGLLFGYDTAVISGAIGFLKSHFELNAAREGWAAACALAGCVVGVALAGYASDRFGRRTTLVGAAVLFLVSALGTALPRTLDMFIVFRILGGVGVGAASMTSPMYIAEISPARLRGRLVSLNQFAIIFGMLVVYFVNYFIAGQGDVAWNETQGWRWMFGSEALPALLLLGLLALVPESPRWLVARGRKDRARSILSKVHGDAGADPEMAVIERALAERSLSLSHLFRPGLRRVLVIGVVLAVLQQVTGINVFLYYAPEIFKEIAGDGVDSALLQTVVVGAVNLGFTVLAIFTVDRLGRKPLMVYGALGMGAALTALGFTACFGRTDGFVLIFILGYIACFALSLGPVTWVILSEIFPNRIRGRALAVATLCLWLANLAVSQTFPILDENAWLVERFHHGFPFWIYGGFCLVTVIFVAWAVPETRGKSLEEIEDLWTP